MIPLIDHSFSIPSMHQNHLESLSKKISGPHPQNVELVGVRWGPRMCILVQSRFRLAGHMRNKTCCSFPAQTLTFFPVHTSHPTLDCSRPRSHLSQIIQMDLFTQLSAGSIALVLLKLPEHHQGHRKIPADLLSLCSPTVLLFLCPEPARPYHSPSLATSTLSCLCDFTHTFPSWPFLPKKPHTTDGSIVNVESPKKLFLTPYVPMAVTAPSFGLLGTFVCASNLTYPDCHAFWL